MGYSAILLGSALTGSGTLISLEKDPVSVDIATKMITEVDQAEYENVDVALDLKPIYDYNWSPDSRYIAYTKMNADLLYQENVYYRNVLNDLRGTVVPEVPHPGEGGPPGYGDVDGEAFF